MPYLVKGVALLLMVAWLYVTLTAAGKYKLLEQNVPRDDSAFARSRVKLYRLLWLAPAMIGFVMFLAWICDVPLR